MMPIKGAGILPSSHLQGSEHFLLVKEGSLFSPHWAEPGGIVDPGETARGAAIRESYEESRGVLGSPWRLWFRLGLWPSSVDVRSYRCYLMSLPQSFADIRDDFHNSSLKHGAFGETRDISWIKSDEIYAAVAGYKARSGATVRMRDGRKLRARTVAVIRRLPGFQSYLQNQVVTITGRYTTVLGMSGPERNVPVIRLASGKAFAVLNSGNSVDDLVLKDCSVQDLQWRPGVWEWLCCTLLVPVLGDWVARASQAEKNAIFAALGAESLWSKLRHNYLVTRPTLKLPTLG